MTLRNAIDQYIAWRQVHGAKFVNQAYILRRWLNSVDGEVECDAVTAAQVRAYLAGNGPLTPYRAVKYSVLAGFYRYAISRGYASASPLPDNEPRRPPSAPPYIYSHDELGRLFGAIGACRRHAVKLDAHTFRALLLLLYGAGLRSAEALNLTLADVDLAAAVLTVRDTKFYKSRLVPVGSRLADTLRTYATRRARRPLAQSTDSSFLANRDGSPVVKRTAQAAFARLLCTAAIHGADEARQSPCLHSFRHSFAVHRLTAWYRQGADVQRLLPILSTYLGHQDPAGTQVYLSMTPQLLQQASLRFERYERGGNDE